MLFIREGVSFRIFIMCISRSIYRTFEEVDNMKYISSHTLHKIKHVSCDEAYSDIVDQIECELHRQQHN